MIKKTDPKKKKKLPWEAKNLTPLEAALKFRAERDKTKQAIVDANSNINSFKESLIEEQTKKKILEKDLKKFENEELFLSKIAKIPSAEEERKNRPFYGTKAFFDLLNLFDAAGKNDFSVFYNSLNDTKTLAKLVLESAHHGNYNNNNVSDSDSINDYVVIKGSVLRKKISDELEKQKVAKEQAKIMLDNEYKNKSFTTT